MLRFGLQQEEVYMAYAEKAIPDGFESPTATPADPEQRTRWQAANRAWWQDHPMRYDFTTVLAQREFSPEFYEEIDRRFFSSVREYMPWTSIPFDPLIDFSRLASQDVLEIGTGNGSHAALLARHARSFTGIDLTNYAVDSTQRRLTLAGLSGRALQMDAEQMSFPDQSFDFIWSWGVIHHSADTGRILAEIARVLRPGGRAVTMVYHRSAWNYYVVGLLIHGLARRQLLKGRSTHETLQRTTDGAIARMYSIAEWTELASLYLDVEKIRIYGSKTDLFPIPAGRLKDTLIKLTPSPLTRFFTNTCRFGWFLVSSLAKRQ
jgi:SAM-dependent methyltransferase